MYRKIKNNFISLIPTLFWIIFLLLIVDFADARPGGGQSYSDDSNYSSGSSDDDYGNDNNYTYDYENNNGSREYSNTEDWLYGILTVLMVLSFIFFKIYIKIKEKRNKLIILSNPTPKNYLTNTEKNIIAINELTAIDSNFSKTLFIDFVSSVFTKYYAWQGTKEFDNLKPFLRENIFFDAKTFPLRYCEIVIGSINISGITLFSDSHTILVTINANYTF